MSKNCKCSEKSQRSKRKDENQSGASLAEITAQEAAALAEMSAEEFNALIDGRSDVAHGI